MWVKLTEYTIPIFYIFFVLVKIDCHLRSTVANKNDNSKNKFRWTSSFFVHFPQISTRIIFGRMVAVKRSESSNIPDQLIKAVVTELLVQSWTTDNAVQTLSTIFWALNRSVILYWTNKPPPPNEHSLFLHLRSKLDCYARGGPLDSLHECHLRYFWSTPAFHEGPSLTNFSQEIIGISTPSPMNSCVRSLIVMTSEIPHTSRCSFQYDMVSYEYKRILQCNKNINSTNTCINNTTTLAFG